MWIIKLYLWRIFPIIIRKKNAFYIAQSAQSEGNIPFQAIQLSSVDNSYWIVILFCPASIQQNTINMADSI